MKSLLFVPADGGKKLDKAMASGADAIIVDLEDSISAERKPAARAPMLEFLKGATAHANRPKILVRINDLTTPWADEDIDAAVQGKPDAILQPKAEGGASVIHLDAKLTAREAMHGVAPGSISIYALATETAKAFFVAGTYGGSSRRLKGLTWGAEDLSAELGASANRGADGAWLPPYQMARSLCLAGAAAAQIPALDTVYVDFKNEAGLRRECEEAKRDGFTGKLAIHPAQVAIINDVFSPNAAEIEHARKVVAAFAAKPGAGTIGIDGKMYDRPHLARANALLAQGGNVVGNG